MSLSIKVRLLSILPKLMLIGMRGLEDVLKEFPEATTRSMLLRLFDDRGCLLYTSPSPRDKRQSRMPSSA